MLNIRQRRSPRHALELPIRVFGVDFQGRDFVEDSRTLVVSRHGAKIRLTRKLIPEMEIRILCQHNKREGLFRVVGQAGQPTGKFSFWGVECLEPAENIYEIEDAMPASEPSPRPAPPPSPELAPKPVPQLDAKLSWLAENIHDTGVAMPAPLPSPEFAPRPTPLPSPALAPKPVPQLDAKLSSLAENIYETGVAMPAPLPSPELAPKPVLQLDAKLSSPPENIYETGVAMPAPLPSPALAPRPVPQLDAKLFSKHKSSARAWLSCAKCAMRELVELDETQSQAMRKLKGLMRSCPACGATTLWKRLGL